MSRRAGFIPAARFEVASETDSFREGWDASDGDGDGDGGSRDAVPPPRPTGVPAAVLSGERARPDAPRGGDRARKRVPSRDDDARRGAPAKGEHRRVGAHRAETARREHDCPRRDESAPEGK